MLNRDADVVGHMSFPIGVRNGKTYKRRLDIGPGEPARDTRRRAKQAMRNPESSRTPGPTKVSTAQRYKTETEEQSGKNERMCFGPVDICWWTSPGCVSEK